MLFTEPQARTGTGLEMESFGVLWCLVLGFFSFHSNMTLVTSSEFCALSSFERSRVPKAPAAGLTAVPLMPSS